MAKLLMTVEQMKDRSTWLKKRKNGLGGSDAAVIMGLTPWKSPYALWAEKTGLIPEEDLSNNQRVYWGQRNEAAIAEWFAEQTGKHLRKRGLIQSCQYPWMLATVDRQILGENAGLEIKTAGVDQYKNWANGAIPAMYIAQCQWYMAVTGCSHWYIAVLIGGNDARWNRIDRDETYIQELIQKGQEFWNSVVTKTPPPVDGTESTKTALGTQYTGGNTNILLLDTKNIVDAYADMKKYEQEESNAKKAKETCKQVIMQAMGNHEIAMIGDAKITWKLHAGRTTLNADAIAKNHPDIYKKYLKVGQPTRVFKIS